MGVQALGDGGRCAAHELVVRTAPGVAGIASGLTVRAAPAGRAVLTRNISGKSVEVKLRLGDGGALYLQLAQLTQPSAALCAATPQQWAQCRW